MARSINPKPGTASMSTTNERTGRPVRKARRIQEDSPFVDSAIAVSDASDSEDSDDSTESTTLGQKRKRKTAPAPTALSLDGVNETSPDSSSDSFSEDDSDSSSDTASESGSEPDSMSSATSPQPEGIFKKTNAGNQVVFNNLVINVPPGHIGPLMVHLDVPTFSSAPTAPIVAARDSSLEPASDASSEAASQSSQEPQIHKTGFLDLPAELRNDVYRRVLVSDRPLYFDSATNFCRSSAFLRTCHQVHEEARSILYSENHFIFDRKTRRHGSYWENDWSEVGFKAVRKFLKMIGRTNLGLIRTVTLFLEDATPCLNPKLMTADDRRFVRDEVLLDSLKRLAKYSKLEKLDLLFRGRRRVERSDLDFLKAITAIKADKVRFVDSLPTSSWPMESKQEENVRKLCLTRMVRRTNVFQ